MNTHLTAINPELIKPYSVGLQKLRSRFGIRFRAQTSARKVENEYVLHIFRLLKTKNGKPNSHITERRRRDFRNPKLAESGKPDLKMPLSTIAKFSGGTNISSASSELSGGEKSAVKDIWPLELSSFIVLAPKSGTVKDAVLCWRAIHGISSFKDLSCYLCINYYNK